VVPFDVIRMIALTGVSSIFFFLTTEVEVVYSDWDGLVCYFYF
jgi:hypothetical protein